MSHETIYRAIYAHGGRGLAKGLHAGLHRQHRRRKHRRAEGAGEPQRLGPLGRYKKISDRPEGAAHCIQIGHIEGDLITGAYNRSAIATLLDRASRKVWLAGFPEDHGAEAMLAPLIETIERIPAEFPLSPPWLPVKEAGTNRQVGL